MAIPTSGQIGVSQHLNRELGRSINATFSIDTAENGGYGAINDFSRSRPSSANPAAFSEWYGYDHSAGGGGPQLFPLPEIGYDRVNPDTACRNAALGRHTLIWGDGPSLVDCGLIYGDDRGSRFAPSGYYAENFSGIYRFWNGSSFGAEAFCRI